MNKTWITCGACLLLSALLMAFGFAGSSGGPAAEKPLYAMIVTDDIGAAVMQQKQGVQTAAAELSVEIKTYTADPNTPLGPQIAAFVAAAGRGGAKGILLTACGAEEAALAAKGAAALAIPLAALFAEADGNVIRVATDYQAQGGQLAKALLAAGGNGPVLVLTDAGDPEAQARLRGAAQALGDLCAPHAAEPGEALLTLLESLADGERVLALTGPLTVAAADALRGRAALWGVDPGDARVALLSTGAAMGLAFEMPYAQGYLAVRALRAGSTGPTVYSPSRVVDRETMYLSENVKLMFPLLQ